VDSVMPHYPLLRQSPTPTTPSVPIIPSPSLAVPVTSSIPVANRLYSDSRSCLPHWLSSIAAWSSADPTKIDHCNRLRDCIINGIPIDPEPLPDDRAYANTTTVSDHIEAVRDKIKYYLAMGALRVTDRSSLAAVHPLHVVVRPGKSPRIVLDLSKNLNELLKVPHMRVATSIDDAISNSTPGCWYGKLDIKDCFLSFSVAADAQRFLGFHLDGVYYQFLRMIFGLNTAPELCELMLSVVSWLLRQRGVKHCRYCDDILIFGATEEECNASIDIALEVLELFGLAVAHPKTVRACQRIVFLGIVLDSITCTVSCPEDRVAELLRLLKATTTHGAIHSLHFVQSIIGKLSFASHVLPGARPFFRSLIDLTKGMPKKGLISLSHEVRSDLKMWYYNLQHWNGRQRWRGSVPTVVATDASLSGFGAHVLSSPFNDVLPSHLQIGCGLAGQWCGSHRHFIRDHRQIGWAELFAVVVMVLAVGPHCRDSTIELLVDNQSDVAVINRQSTRSPSLLTLLRRLYSAATEFNLSIIARHIAGSSNTIADSLSRYSSPDVVVVPVGVSVIRVCSCLIPSPERPPSRQWSGSSLLWPSARRHAELINPPSASMPTIVLPPVDRGGLRSTNLAYAQRWYGSAVDGRSKPSLPTSRHSSSGMIPVRSVPSPKESSFGGPGKVWRTSTVNLIMSDPHMRSHLPTSPESSHSSTSDPIRIPVTGAPSSLDSMVSSVSVNIPVTRSPNLPNSSSATSSSSQPASSSPYRGARPMSHPPKFDSARVPIS